MKKLERKIIHPKKQLHTIFFKLKISTIEKHFHQYGNKVSMFEALNEVYEEKVTMEENMLLTRWPTALLLSGNVEYLDETNTLLILEADEIFKILIRKIKNIYVFLLNYV